MKFLVLEPEGKCAIITGTRFMLLTVLFYSEIALRRSAQTIGVTTQTFD